MVTKEHSCDKSGDSLLLPEGEPTSEWGLEQLGAYCAIAILPNYER